jgi:hypothetical protein
MRLMRDTYAQFYPDFNFAVPKPSDKKKKKKKSENDTVCNIPFCTHVFLSSMTLFPQSKTTVDALNLLEHFLDDVKYY